MTKNSLSSSTKSNQKLNSKYEKSSPGCPGELFLRPGAARAVQPEHSPEITSLVRSVVHRFATHHDYLDSIGKFSSFEPSFTSTENPSCMYFAGIAAVGSTPGDHSNVTFAGPSLLPEYPSRYFSS